MLDGMSRLRETTINCELGPAGRERSSCVFLDDASRTVAMTVVFDLPNMWLRDLFRCLWQSQIRANGVLELFDSPRFAPVIRMTVWVIMAWDATFLARG